MELSKAKKVTEIVSGIDRLQKQIKLFNNTKDFCEIEFSGENGNERVFSYSINEIELRQDLRSLVEDKLKARLKKLISELNKL